jgi:hypothetical protein
VPVKLALVIFSPLGKRIDFWDAVSVETIAFFVPYKKMQTLQ